MCIIVIMNSCGREEGDSRMATAEPAATDCPVVHADYSEHREACSYFRLADSMRDHERLYGRLLHSASYTSATLTIRPASAIEL